MMEREKTLVNRLGAFTLRVRPSGSFPPDWMIERTANMSHAERQMWCDAHDVQLLQVELRGRNTIDTVTRTPQTQETTPDVTAWVESLRGGEEIEAHVNGEWRRGKVRIAIRPGDQGLSVQNVEPREWCTIVWRSEWPTRLRRVEPKAVTHYDPSLVKVTVGGTELGWDPAYQPIVPADVVPRAELEAALARVKELEAHVVWADGRIARLLDDLKAADAMVKKLEAIAALAVLRAAEPDVANTETPDDGAGMLTENLAMFGRYAR